MMKQLITILLIFWSFSTFANDLTITYITPNNLEVCQSGNFGIILENTTNDTAKNINVSVQFPNGVTYVLNSVNGSTATESNVSNLLQPVFGLADFLPSQKDTFWVTAQAGCGLVSAINNGVVFQNTITATFTGGTKTITTLPYSIETALLVITNVSPTTTAGVVWNDVLTRTITIRNTRPGALDTFFVKDNHSGNLEITSTLGTVVGTNPNEFEIMLTGADFATIGDGDGFFELNEIIIITENIIIKSCGGTVTSDISTYWGCNNSTCQTDNNIAAIGVGASPFSANLQFRPTINYDVCYDGSSPIPQQMVIKNIGDGEASFVQFSVRNVLTLFDKYINAIDDSSFTMTINGTTTPILPVYWLDQTFNDCFADTDLKKFITLALPNIGAGDSIILDWSMPHCLDSCTLVHSGWGYDFAYFDNCPQGARTADSLNFVGISSFQSVATPGFQKLEDEQSVSIDFKFIDTSNVITQASGYMRTHIQLPCGISWDNASTAFNFSGQAPYQLTYDTIRRIIQLDHSLPMAVNQPVFNFDVELDCDATCGVEDGYFVVEITSNIYLSSSCDTTASRGIEFCSDDVGIQIACEPDTLCQDTFVGMIFSEYSMERINFGLPDNDDNKVPDVTGSIDPLKVISSRAMIGDTIRVEGKGKVIDEFNSNYEFAKIETRWSSSASNSTLHTPEGLTLESRTIHIYDSTANANYTCANMDYYATFDRDTLSYFINLDASYLAGLGCVPANFTWQEHDSIHYISTYKVRYNVADDQPQNFPALALVARPKLHLSNPSYFPDFYSYKCDSAFATMGLSGYKIIMGIGSSAVKACEPQDFTGLNSVQFYLAEPNYFLYEYREFATLQNLGIKIDPNFTIDSTRLNFAGIPNSNILLLERGLNFDSTGTDNTNFYDIETLRDTVFDEGFYFFIQSIVEGDCSLSGFYPVEFKGQLQLSKELNDSIVNLLRINGSGIRPLRPDLAFSSLLPNTIATSDTVCWDVSLTNFPNNVGSLQSKEAFNMYLHPISVDGTLTNFYITDLSTNTNIIPTNGIFTYGDLPKNATENFRVCALNLGCDTEILNLKYGWNCSTYNNVNDETCYELSRILTVESVRPELEMVLTNPTGSPFGLCTNIPYHVAKVFNAELGLALDLKLQAVMPQGLDIVNGTCQLSYPDGSTFVNIPNPVAVNGNIYEWDISSLQAAIGANGLKNINQYPDNTFSVRFNVIADCDYIGGSFITFRTVGNNQCANPTNTVTRTGSPINISGAIPSYTTTINVLADTAAGCANTQLARINILTGGATGSDDSVFVTLPYGISYLANSYNAISNATNNAPFITIENGVQILKWKLNNVSAGTTISFEIETQGYTNFDCGDELLMFVQTVSPANALCVSSNTICNILVSTGVQTHKTRIQRADLSISNLAFTITANGNLEDIRRSMTIQNSGAAHNSSNPIIVQYYFDADGDGMITAADLLLNTETLNLNIAPNGSVNLSLGNIFTTLPNRTCHILAVIDTTNNCICSGDVATSSQPISYIIQPIISACPNTDVPIGITQNTNNSYVWILGNVSCDTCATANINISNTTGSQMFNSFVLQETQPSGCVTNYTTNVATNPILTGNTDSLAICTGDSTELLSNLATSYLWSGENVSNPNNQNTFVTPTQSQWYQLTLTDNLGCTFQDSAWVAVNAVPAAVAGNNQSICDNQSFTQLGAIFDPNYNYHWTPYATINNPFVHDPIVFPSQTTTYQLVVTDANGCFSTDQATVFVSNTPAPTSANASICYGDSIIYNGATLSQSGDYDFNLQAWNGCDSLHTLFLIVLDTSLQVSDIEICQGDSIELGGAIYKQTGTYCHDFVAFNGCDSTICVNLNVENLLFSTADTILCFGDTLDWNNEIYTESGDYVQTFTAVNGCDSSHQVTLDFYDEMNVEASPDELEIPIGTSEDVFVTGGTIYQWSPIQFLSCADCANPTITPTSDIVYQVLVKDENDCEEKIFVNVKTLNSCSEGDMGIPNAFTPNNDGRNDDFGVIEPFGISNFSMRIYDRWGEKVFETTNPNERWKAGDRKTFPQDTYIYVIEGDCYGNNPFYYSGEVLVIR